MEKGVKLPETIEDILLSPSQFGLPTFQEFCKNPGAYRLGEEYLLERVDAGSKFLTNFRKYTFEIAGYRVKTLEEVQLIAYNEGIDITKMKMIPTVVPNTFREETIHVKFVKPREDGKAKKRRNHRT